VLVYWCFVPRLLSVVLFAMPSMRKYTLGYGTFHPYGHRTCAAVSYHLDTRQLTCVPVIDGNGGRTMLVAKATDLRYVSRRRWTRRTRGVD
jgi:hypothetical protein